MSRLPTISDLPMHSWEPYSAMHRERVRAHEKFSQPPHRSQEQLPWDHPSWLRVLTEELGEVARAQNDHELGVWSTRQLREELYKELVQLGAMAAAWLDALGDEAEGIAR